MKIKTLAIIEAYVIVLMACCWPDQKGYNQGFQDCANKVLSATIRNKVYGLPLLITNDCVIHDCVFIGTANTFDMIVSESTANHPINNFIIRDCTMIATWQEEPQKKGGTE